ncbi:hypothetical protein IB237_23495 [Agrobacterium sp. AGB01]|uniref:hypothetical protein n=1 Tax=Agrobacterium sp. AGB01 TaxID=2769302 RepID=UPI00177B875C|nr:hypothetical protein [Agrobacterium sp. AGB01]MBD9390170.1 hypothetical protein [Agrobacterium sp. AGB01]
MQNNLIAAARAVVDQWDSPNWKTKEPTAKFIENLRRALQEDTHTNEKPAGEPLELPYKNWRGEISTRKIQPIRIEFGSTEWHPEPQWLLVATDVEKNAERSFALKDFNPQQPSRTVVTKGLDWSGFKGVKINEQWTPDDQELIYTALGVYNGDGDMDEDAREQIIERLLAAWQRLSVTTQVQDVAKARVDNRHRFEPNKKYPWFCAICGYAPHEPLAHLPAAPAKQEG